MKQDIRNLISKLVKEEMDHFVHPHHDHEAKMAKSEIRDMVELGAELYNMIQEGENLPGWASAYITLASDYIHSVHQYMVEHKNK